ncbi:MAG: hypothetical protein Q8L52_03000 [bacterium]|nr:hypothetical protein [bacterium]
MSHKRLWVAATIIASVVLVGFVLSVPHTRDIGKTSLPQNEAAQVPSVTLHDSYKKGMHTITGSIETPNACTQVAVQASLQNDASGASSILVVLSMPEDSGVCLQVPMNVDFKVTVNAPANLPITATVNGIMATTTES